MMSKNIPRIIYKIRMAIRTAQVGRFMATTISDKVKGSRLKARNFIRMNAPMTSSMLIAVNTIVSSRESRNRRHVN